MLKFCGIDHSQFGEKPSYHPKTSMLDVHSISSYSSNYSQTVIITKNGIAMAAGDNKEKLISGSLPNRTITKFTEFDIKDSEGRTYQPISAHCGENFTIYLVSDLRNDKRNVLAYKSNQIKSDFPIFLSNSSLNPVALFGGLFDAAAIDESGSVIFIYHPYEKSYSELIATQLPDGEKAVNVAFCDPGVFVLSSNGKLYFSEKIQNNNIAFSRVDFFEGKNISDISGTYLHCLVVTKDGKVYGYGGNYYGSLGIGDSDKSFKEFKEIKSLSKYKIKKAYAGCDASLFQTEKGKLLGCGNNNYNVLFSKDSKCSENLPIETEITEGACFCVLGECSSSVFINFDPLMSPNHQIDIEKFTKNSSKKQSKTDNDEIIKLKAEVSRLKEKIRVLESQRTSQNSKNFEIFDQKTVNDMSIIENLGRGAQSEVYKVSRPHYYVLKILFLNENKRKSKSGEAHKQLKRFIQEYEILRLLNHQNIIRTFGFCFGDEKHPPSILLQFCPHNLNDYIEEMNSIQKVCAIFEICLGMEAVHKSNLIHRDLKPENILIDDKDHIRISDFGVACLVDVESQTQSKTTGVGTLKFMAPELLNENDHYDNKVDVYSFGVVVFFILTGGKMPKISFADQVTGKKAKIPDEINEISRNLINSCWAALPDERPSFTQIIELIKSKNFNLIDGSDKNINQIKKFLSI